MVVIQNVVNSNLFSEHKLISAIEKLMRHLQVSDSELLIRIVSIKEITSLNKKYRAKDKKTNVLAFVSDLPEEIEYKVLGDVVICADVVEEEALTSGKSFINHIIHLSLHGLLHLLGYDHIEDLEAEKMQELEIELLQIVGIKNPYLNL